MKIAVWHNLPSGGAKRALYNQVEALIRRGHYLEAWTTDYASQDFFPLSHLIKEHTKPLAKEIINLNHINSPVKRIIKSIKLLKKLSLDSVKEIEADKFDLIFTNSCGISYAPFIGLYTKIPTVLYLGEPNRKLYEASPSGNLWELPLYGFSLNGLYRYYKDFLRAYSRRIQVREEIAAVRSYSQILVNSLFSRESLKRAYGVESTLCYLGTDENHFKIIGDVIKKPFVAGMGRISPAKNIEAAITVISGIPAKDRPALKWISNGYVPDYYDKIIRYAREVGVEFIPLVDLPDAELVRVLNEAAVMICTSHLEPFGLAPLEANMCGTFVVAISEGGFRESILNGNNGLLAKGDTPDEMAKLIIPFCSDTGYAKKMGLQAREYAVKFWNREQMADNIEKNLRSVLK